MLSEELLYGCYAEGDLIITGTREECEIAAEDVKRDFPELAEVGVDVILQCRGGCGGIATFGDMCESCEDQP